jgi:ceramide glucosyltransferase
MTSLLHAGALVTLGWSATVASVSLEAARRAVVRARRTRREATARLGAPQVASAQGPRVLVVRPCAGGEPWLDANLRSIASPAAPRRSFDICYRIAVADARDLALPAAAAAAAALAAAGVDAEVVLTAARGPNRKVSQIQAVVATMRVPFDVLLVADSDVDLTHADLDALVAPLTRSDGAVDVTWAPPAELAEPETLADRASSAVLGGSLHAFPLLCTLDEGGLVGKLFAARRAALTGIGGIGALAEHLGEDMELARRIKARGGLVVASPIVARSVLAGRTWDQAAARLSRWLMVIRAQRPTLLPSYPLLFFATPLIVLAAALTALGAPPLAALAAALAIVSRLMIALVAAWASGREVNLRRAAVEAVIGDLLLAVAFARVFQSRQVVWRDNVLTIDRSGLAREGAMEVPHGG